ncbi:MAG: hypothetical protein WAU78_11875 [Roseiarcus sp.]
MGVKNVMMPLAGLALSSIVNGSVMAAPCEALLKNPVPSCPAATYSPDDCDRANVFGKKGDKFHPNIINIMSSGHVYACASHEICIEIKDLIFIGCRFEFKNRLNYESPEYMSHFFLNLN